jgi:hypothetical protein
MMRLNHISSGTVAAALPGSSSSRSAATIDGGSMLQTGRAEEHGENVRQEPPHDPIGDRQMLARFTKDALAENGLSFWEQEAQTTVKASEVFNMVNGWRCPLTAVQRFAAFASHRTRNPEAQTYWRALMDRLQADSRKLQASDDAAPAAVAASPGAGKTSPMPAAARTQLAVPAPRSPHQQTLRRRPVETHITTSVAAAMTPAPAEAEKTAVHVRATAPTMSAAEALMPDEVAALYSSLALPHSRDAVVRMLRALCEAENVMAYSPTGR